MFKIKDIVELGHMEETGGSVNITLAFKDHLDKDQIEDYLSIIDMLDHSVISAHDFIKTKSARFFHLGRSCGIMVDIVQIISKLIKEYEDKRTSVNTCINCIISLNKIEYESEILMSSGNILDYSTEG